MGIRTLPPEPKRAAPSIRWGFLSGRALQYFFLLILCAIVLGPVLTAILGGLKTTGELFDSPFGLPTTPRWETPISTERSIRSTSDISQRAMDSPPVPSGLRAISTMMAR